MRLFCTEEFKDEIAALRKNGSYASVEQAVAEAYCDISFTEACAGDSLAEMPGMMYRKRRLDGSGGYRVYTLAVIVGEKVYLGYIHPKTGKYGQDNLPKEQIKAVMRQILDAKKSGNLYCVEAEDASKKRLRFTSLEIAPAAGTMKP